MTRWDLGFGTWVLGFAAALVVFASEASAQVEMPDPSLIHGKAIPAQELADGTVTVRVVREAIGNNIPDQDVRALIGSTTRRARTDEAGRAEFKNLPPGDQATAEVTVDGERLVSEPFTVPREGGLRVILVAGMAKAAERKSQEEAEALAAPAEKGIVVFGGGTRILMDFQDDALQVFYVLEILNNARARVDIGGPLVIDLPQGAGGAATLEGSSTQAIVSGDRVTVTGPFAPGQTMVQVGFRLNYSGTSYRLEQTWPAAVQQVTMAVEKVGALALTSTQFATTGQVTADNGTPYLLGNGPALAAGATFTAELTGLPSHSQVPRYAALGLAVVIVLAGVWLSVSGRTSDATIRARLTAQRDTLLGELAKAEERRREGLESPKQGAKRQRLLAELEQLYGELDEASVSPRGGGEGASA